MGQGEFGGQRACRCAWSSSHSARHGRAGGASARAEGRGLAVNGVAGGVEEAAACAGPDSACLPPLAARKTLRACATRARGGGRAGNAGVEAEGAGGLRRAAVCALREAGRAPCVLARGPALAHHAREGHLIAAESTTRTYEVHRRHRDSGGGKMAERKAALTRAPERPELRKLLNGAKTVTVTDAELRAQRASFVYGNAPKGSRITKDSATRSVDRIRVR